MPAALLVLLLLQTGTVLITRGGERLRGAVSRESGAYIVATPLGPRRVPETEAALVFGHVSEPVARAEARFADAKRFYDEASKLPETHPWRNTALLLAVDLAQHSSQELQLLEPHYGIDLPSLGKSVQVIMQFVRLCRGAASSDRAGAPPSAPRTGLIPLEEPGFDLPAGLDPAPRRALEEELGPGLLELARTLDHPDEARRLETVRALVHPPSPVAVPALVRLLETERDPAILDLLAAGLAWADPGPVLKSLDWMRRETDPARRAAGFSLLRRSEDRASLDLALEWFAAMPPASHPDRALFASAFRRHPAAAVQSLKELLTRNRQAKLQVEIVRQLGVIGDKSAGPMLLKTLDAYPRDSAASLFKLGRPAVPILIEGARSHDQESRRLCNGLLRRLTGVQSANLPPFETWWKANAKTVLEEEKKRGDGPVEAGAFAAYDLPLESIVP